MKILKWIGIAVAGLLVVLVAVGYMMPENTIVSRSREIAAPDSVLFNYVNRLDQWEKWSAWAKLDPNMKMEYSPARQGVGAWYAWSGNSKVGKGKLEITDVIQNKLIVDKMTFEDYTPAVGRVMFDAKGDKTLVTMEMDLQYGNNPFMRLMGGMMKSMINNDYDKCLENMDKLATGK